MDIDDRPPDLRVEPIGQVDALDAGVVDQHIDTSLVRVDIRERRLDRGKVRHVGLEVARPLTGSLGLAKVDRDRVRALLQERPDDGIPDAPCAARDHDHLVGECLIHRVLAPLRLLRCNRFR